MKFQLLTHLKQTRGACTEVEYARTDAERAIAVRRIQEYLCKVIVDQGQLPNLEQQAAARLAAVAGQEGGDFATLGSALNTRLGDADLANDAAAKASARETVKILFEHWQNYMAVLQAEIDVIDAGPGAKPANPAAIDRDALSRFIREAIPGEDNVTISDVRPASIGNSKATLLISLTGNKVLPAEIVMRKDQAFNFLDTYIVDEFPALKLLHDNGVPVPEPYALEATGDVLGLPFLLCARVRGEATGTIYYPPPRNDAMMASIARALAKLHSVPVEGLDHIGAKRPQRQDYIREEIRSHWETWQSLGVINPIVDTAFAWVRSNLDKAFGRYSLVHNDYSYHNILIDNDEVSAVLDWEFIHIGNPAADIAYFQVDTDKGAGFDFFMDEYVKGGGVYPGKDELDFYYVWAHTRFAIMNYQTTVGVNNGDMKGLRNMMPTLHFMPKPLFCLGEKLDELLGR
ncbi:MAG: phosphotransferase family protein [Porticoccaceae bacterium]